MFGCCCTGHSNNKLLQTPYFAMVIVFICFGSSFSLYRQVLLAAFYVLLHRYTGQDDIIVGSPAAGRIDIKEEGNNHLVQKDHHLPSIIYMLTHIKACPRMQSQSRKSSFHLTFSTDSIHGNHSLLS